MSDISAAVERRNKFLMDKDEIKVLLSLMTIEAERGKFTSLDYEKCRKRLEDVVRSM